MHAVVPKSEKQTRKSDKLTRQQVGSKLKQLYSDIVSEPVPDRFIDLIEKLGSDEGERADRARGSAKQKDSM